jgi:hypothetical protein
MTMWSARDSECVAREQNHSAVRNRLFKCDMPSFLLANFQNSR